MTEDASTLPADLRASRERLLAVVAGVSEEQFKRRPPVEAVERAGDWSIAEVLAHLLAFEQRQGDRVEALLRGEDPALVTLTDDERTTEARQGRLAPVPQVIHGLLAARRRLERALTGPEDAARAVVPVAVARLVREDVIAHEEAHRLQIEAVKAALAVAKPNR